MMTPSTDETTTEPMTGSVAEAETEIRICDTCGNHYDKTFTVVRGEQIGIFDSFECAAQAMAPNCENCGCRILGHGVETDGQIFCCAHCAREEDEYGLVDRS